jgi:apolipoprotein N-acyltransferase
MIHYGGLDGWLAYLLLAPGALVVGIFPGLFAAVLAQLVRVFRTKALLLAPFLWVAFEWARLGVTGQLWNALGYSQAFQPELIQSAKWGGVYLISFIVAGINAALAFATVNRCLRAVLSAAGLIAVLTTIALIPSAASRPTPNVTASVVAIQPNVPMTLVKSADDMRELTARHVQMSEESLKKFTDSDNARLLIWPESPMNFTYANDAPFREFIARFARDNRTAILLNSQEPAPNNGVYNSAILINEDGQLIGQYDKIRLLPFGEYVPLPRWLPGASLITAIVGDFAPGTNYTLLPAGEAQMGVFICIESAYPSIARMFASEGADVLVNISNDGYLGRTAVLRQHLSNAVLRAVENQRPVLRVTNSGITAYIEPNGRVLDATASFEPAVRTWTVAKGNGEKSFYTRYGDLFALGCSLVSGLAFAAAMVRGQRSKLRKKDLESK